MRKKDLQSAVDAGIITEEQAQRLKEHWDAPTPATQSAFRVPAYFGAFLIIGSLTWFATKAFSDAEPWVLVVTAFSYLALFWSVGHWFHTKGDRVVESNLLLTIAVFTVPLAVYSVQKAMNWFFFDFPGEYDDFYVWIRGGWFFMEISTIAMSTVFLAVYRRELLTLPLSFALWFLSMDVTPLLFGVKFDFDELRQVSIAFGLAMLVVSYVLDLRKKEHDYSFWLYLFGLLTFWGALSASSTTDIFLKALYAAMNVGLVVISILFSRKVFLVFGSLGIFLYLWDLADQVFRDSFYFPLILSGVGLVLLGGGFLLLRSEKPIAAWLDTHVPVWLTRWLPHPRD